MRSRIEAGGVHVYEPELGMWPGNSRLARRPYDLNWWIGRFPRTDDRLARVKVTAITPAQLQRDGALSGGRPFEFQRVSGRGRQVGREVESVLRKSQERRAQQGQTKGETHFKGCCG